MELELHGDVNGFVSAVEGLGCESAPGALNRLPRLVLGDKIEVSDIYRVAAEKNVPRWRVNLAQRRVLKKFT